MKPPDIESKLIDQAGGVTYIIKAYRPLSHQEMILAVRHYHAQRDKRRKLKPGSVVTIISIWGLNDGGLV